MSVKDLSDKEKNSIIEAIKNDENLSKKHIYKLFKDEEDVFLFWNGRDEERSNIVLPFHTIEHIDEPRKEKVEGSGQLFDTRGRQQKGWTNKLIWGDNKLILSSLVNGPMRNEIDAQGGLKLVYIDPPFAVGADFTHEIELNGEKFIKRQNVLEEIAYRDTWGKGLSSYLRMIYERLKLIHELLAYDGSIFVHLDWRVNSIVKIILDEIFGSKSFRNEIVWCYTGPGSPHMKQFNRKHDTLLWYSKSDNWIFNSDDVRVPHDEKTSQNFKSGNVGSGFVADTYDLDEGGKVPEDWWEFAIAQRYPVDGIKRTGYATEKPLPLLDRIVKTASNEGDIVADFFCGSSPFATAAEMNNRKWICSDLGRFAIHLSRKRMINVQRLHKSEGKDYRAFEILNLGKYERQHFMGVPSDVSYEEQQQILEKKQEKYLNLILEGYSANRIEGYKYLHGKRATRFVHVGPLNIPVTRDLVESVYQECKDDLITQVDILGFEFEMGLAPFIEEQMKDKGVDIRLKHIPREVFDPRAVKKGQVKFFDVAYLDVNKKINGNEVQLELSNFVTNYTQDDLEEVEDNLRKRSSKVVIENGEIWNIKKTKDGIFEREQLTSSWTDWIDYWAVDFDYESNREIISVEEDGELKEKWTGNYIFENEWQSFRTKQDGDLELLSAPHTYDEPGRYKIMVKVVDILGIDTSQVFEVVVNE